MQRIIEFWSRRAALLAIVTTVTTALLTIPFLTMAPTENASTEPGGAVFDARDRIDEQFVSSVFPVFVIIEDQQGDLLRAEPLSELLAAEDRVRAELDDSLFSYFDPAIGVEVSGVISLADLIDANLPGGLATATDAQVKALGGQIIALVGEDSPELGISQQSSQDESGQWTVPAIAIPVLGDNNVLGFGNAGINLGTDTAPEEYARDIQNLLGSASGLDVYGVAIDVNLTSGEQGEAAGPFIGFTILAVLIIVGLTFRSYWVLAIAGATLGALMIWLKGISNLIGLKEDLVLTLIVPIAMISFGVDFAFHAVGRYREERLEGKDARPALIGGLAAVSGALLLALTSDVVAFAANITSGIESIIQFGIGAAVALTAAYLLLGIATPIFVAAIEERIGAPMPSRRATLVRWLGSALAAALAMAAVLFMVFVEPAVGVGLLAAYVVLALIIPLQVVARRGGARTQETSPNSVDLFSTPLGSILAVLAGARVVVVPVAIMVTLGAAYFAVQVPTEFDVEDFFSRDTDFVRSLELVDEHVGDRGGEAAQLYVEGALDEPEMLGVLRSKIDEIRNVDTVQYSREDGLIRVDQGVLSVFDAVFESPAAQGAIAQISGVPITDTNGDRIPDTATQVRAVYEVTSEIGVPLDAERLLLTPDYVNTVIVETSDSYATVFAFGLVDSRAQESIAEARSDLAPLASELSDELGGSFVQLTGGPFVRQESLDATSRALNVSLPIAVVLCALIAATFLRSVRYGVVSVVPILMTVAWLYAFMQLTGYAINLVTATIAAVSVGIGIDFAIHYVSRFREELARYGDRLIAVRKAGEGTGTALVASAVSSSVGFGILALAPMPLFAAYGFLTAVMIFMALAATLLVLPSILVMVTKDTPVVAEAEMVAV